MPSNRILRLPEVCRLVGVSRSSVLRLERAGRFPKKFSIGGLHAIGFDEAASIRTKTAPLFRTTTDHPATAFLVAIPAAFRRLVWAQLSAAAKRQAAGWVSPPAAA